jgi:hypothetical protein
MTSTLCVPASPAVAADQSNDLDADAELKTKKNGSVAPVVII